MTAVIAAAPVTATVVPHPAVVDTAALVIDATAGGPVRASVGAYVGLGGIDGAGGEFLATGDVIVADPHWRRLQPGLGLRVAAERKRQSLGAQLVVRGRSGPGSPWYLQAAAGIDGTVFPEAGPNRRNDVFLGLECGRHEGPALAALFQFPLREDIGANGFKSDGSAEYYFGVRSGGYPGLLAILGFAVIAAVGGWHQLVHGD